MSIPISVTFETVSVSFVGFTRNLGLTGLKKRGAWLLILSSLLSLRFFGYSPMWRAGPHCLIVIAGPNDISAVCSHKLCPLVAALICNHLPSDSAKVSTSGALYSTTQFPTEKAQTHTRPCCLCITLLSWCYPFVKPPTTLPQEEPGTCNTKACMSFVWRRQGKSMLFFRVPQEAHIHIQTDFPAM